MRIGDIKKEGAQDFLTNHPRNPRGRWILPDRRSRVVPEVEYKEKEGDEEEKSRRRSRRSRRKRRRKRRRRSSSWCEVSPDISEHPPQQLHVNMHLEFGHISPDVQYWSDFTRYPILVRFHRVSSTEHISPNIQH